MDQKLYVEVRDAEIIVTMTGTTYTVTYFKPKNSPQLLAKDISSRDDPRVPMAVSEFPRSRLEARQRQGERDRLDCITAMYPTSDSRKGRVGVTVPLMRGNHGIQLRVIAAKTARDMQERVEPLKDEIRHTGERKIAAETELGLVNSAGGRVDSYDAEALHCPECWVKREHQAQLTYISPAANGERFGCDTCGSEFVV